ncbi:MAG: hypothetical protein P1V97_07470 [Planctomycetota bacterium]|nr:hypothetical protein [Planctomycetota bacterium]
MKSRPEPHPELETSMDQRALEQTISTIEESLLQIRHSFKSMGLEVTMSDLSLLDSALADLKNTRGRDEHEQIDLVSEALSKLKDVYPALLSLVDLYEGQTETEAAESWKSDVFITETEEVEIEEETLALITFFKVAALVGYTAARIGILYCERAIELSPSEEYYSLFDNVGGLLSITLLHRESLAPVMEEVLGSAKFHRFKQFMTEHFVQLHDGHPDLAMELKEDLFESIEYIDGVTVSSDKVEMRFKIMTGLIMYIVDVVSTYRSTEKD